jgi:oligosaccharyltransferase complex subunit gamma
MRWLSALVAVAALPLSTFAAKSSSTADRFEAFHAQAVSSSPLKLSDANYKKLTSAPRDYSVAVLLTALDAKYGCQLCGMFQPEWDILAKSWTKGDKSGESRLILSTLDFSDGRDTFMSLGLQTAPVLLLFQPTTGPHAVPNPDPIRYDFTNGPPSAEMVHDWLARQLFDRPHPPIYRPIDYVFWTMTLLGLSATASVAFVARHCLWWFFSSRNVWAGLNFMGILLLNGGHMYSQIRQVPYIVGDGRGGISYFAAGFQSQYGVEAHIVTFIYGILCFATISLALKAPRTRDQHWQQVSIIVWGLVMAIVYSYLLSVFRMKNGGYPFRLPPFM